MFVYSVYVHRAFAFWAGANDPVGDVSKREYCALDKFVVNFVVVL